MGAPDLKSLASSKEQPDRHRRSGDSFESWARALEASGLNFDPRTRRWHCPPGRTASTSSAAASIPEAPRSQGRRRVRQRGRKNDPGNVTLE